MLLNSVHPANLTWPFQLHTHKKRLTWSRVEQFLSKQLLWTNGPRKCWLMRHRLVFLVCSCHCTFRCFLIDIKLFTAVSSGKINADISLNCNICTKSSWTWGKKYKIMRARKLWVSRRTGASTHGIQHVTYSGLSYMTGSPN